MKRLLDIVTIVVGLVGLGGIVFSSAPLTAENASLQAARAILVMAFVVIPFCVARSLEKVAPLSFSKWLARLQHARLRPSRKVQPAQSDTLFFDYFFMPGSSRDWTTPSGSRFAMRDRENDTATDQESDN